MIRQQPGASKTSILWPDLWINVASKVGIDFAIFNFVYTHDAHDAQLQLTIEAGAISLNPAFTSHPSPHLANESTVETYRSFLRQTLETLGSVQSWEKKSTDIEALIAFERKIEKIYIETSKTDRQTFNGSFAELQVVTGHSVDWLPIMNAILDRLNSTVPRFTPQSHMKVRNLAYLQLAAELLNTTPISVIQNFFAIALTLQTGGYTSAQMRGVITRFTGHTQNSQNSQVECAALTQAWPLVLSRVYVDAYFSEHEKNATAELVSQIRASFRENLRLNSWLDRATREAAIGKLDAMKEAIAYPDWILDNEQLDGVYAEGRQFDSLSPGRFFENFVKLRLSLSKKELEGRRKVDAKAEQDIYTTLVNAFYSLGNSIILPAAILQPPFFDHQLPWSLNYGAIGAIIGHELTHGFDLLGSQFDANGTRKNWWSNGTLEAFHAKTSCFEVQYGELHDAEVNLSVNGSRTLGENIADNGGVKEAYGAYRAHLKAKKGDALRLPGLAFTSDQLFFVGFANIRRIWCEAITPKRLEDQIKGDSHSPNRYRVNVVLGNTPSFAEAFNCPIGTKMNPREKCAIW